MEKTKELSIDLRQRIINFNKSENSYSTISNRLVIPRSTIQYVIKKFKQFVTTKKFCIVYYAYTNIHGNIIN